MELIVATDKSSLTVDLFLLFCGNSAPSSVGGVVLKCVFVRALLSSCIYV